MISMKHSGLASSMLALILSGCSTLPNSQALAPSQQPVILKGGSLVASIVEPSGAGSQATPSLGPAIWDAAPPVPATASSPIAAQQFPFEPRLSVMAARTPTHVGSLLLFDRAIQHSFDVTGLIADLGLSSQAVIENLNPQALDIGQILLSARGEVYVLDLIAKERVTVATDADSRIKARVTADGFALCYVTRDGTPVLKLKDGDFFTKTRVLSEVSQFQFAIGGENGIARIQDLDISGDGRWIGLVIEGSLYLYDVLSAQLSHLLPLGNQNLAGLAGNVVQVSMSLDGRFVAFTAGPDQVLWVFDRATGLLDTVPTLNAFLASIQAEPLDLAFQAAGQVLEFEIQTATERQKWAYDLQSASLGKVFAVNTSPDHLSCQVRSSSNCHAYQAHG